MVRRAAVAAQIHAVETLLWRAWEAFYAKGLLSISRWRARGSARDGLIPRRRKAQMAQNVSTSARRQDAEMAKALAPYGESLQDAMIYWVRLVEMKPGDPPKHRFKLMVGLGEPERLSGLERDAFTRAYFATLKFREGILTIGQDGEPTLQRNTSIILKAAGVLEKTYVIIAIQFLGTLPEVPMLGPPLREYSLPTTPIARLVQDPRYNPRPPV